jgi:hypothetical protein
MYITKNIKTFSCYFNKYIHNKPIKVYPKKNIKTFSCYFNKYIHNKPIKVYPKKNIKASFLHILSNENISLNENIECTQHNICNYCKGTGKILCLLCKKTDTGINKCNKCLFGKIICWVCDGSGKYY